MANPLLIPIAFATNGAKNIIQKIRQAGQGEDAATWDGGWSGRTMIPKDAGGLPPDGRDFNGLFNIVSEHLIHRQNGEQIKFDPEKVAESGGYAKGILIQSDNTEITYRSLIDNNTFNPNTQPIANRWEVYAGKGSIPIATSTTAGIMQVKNNLVSTDTASALSAAQGKALNDKMLGVGQTWQNVTSNRSSGSTYTNNTGKPITVIVSIRDANVLSGVMVTVGGVAIIDVDDIGAQGTTPYTFIVPAGSTYSVNVNSNTIRKWAELR